MSTLTVPNLTERAVDRDLDGCRGLLFGSFLGTAVIVFVVVVWWLS